MLRYNIYVVLKRNYFRADLKACWDNARDPRDEKFALYYSASRGTNVFIQHHKTSQDFVDSMQSTSSVQRDLNLSYSFDATRFKNLNGFRFMGFLENII